MKLIVGLGNPTKEYEKTRHNMGFIMLDYYASIYNIEITKKKFNGLYGEKIINNEKVIFLKPQNYINNSGEVISKFITYFNISIDNILIIHDDLDTDFGNYKLKQKGSSGGHNGLKSIELYLKTDQYKRLKLGISNDKMIETKDYVLGKFSTYEEKIIEELKKDIKELIDDYFILDFISLMGKYNKKNR
ncbi:MAG: aminoacyl-tRNA hydrolase [Bacilli bacterium]